MSLGLKVQLNFTVTESEVSLVSPAESKTGLYVAHGVKRVCRPCFKCLKSVTVCSLILKTFRYVLLALAALIPKSMQSSLFGPQNLILP